MDITNYIPYGKNNAVTRQKLCEITGLTDRKVRELIEKARHEGYIIINNQDGKMQYKQNRKRALTILHYNKYLRKALQEIGRVG